MSNLYNCLLHLEQLATELGVTDKIALIDNESSVTYEQLYSSSKIFGLSLVNSGINPLDRIILTKKDSIEFVIQFLGCLYVNIIPVLTNSTMSEEDIQDIIKKSGARTNFVINNSNTKFTIPKSYDNSDAFILCTSGTTGQTKLVVHSQKSICGTGLQYGKILQLTKHDVIFSAAKMSHAYGLGNSISIPLTHGATVILESALATPEKIAKHIQDNKVTIFCGVPRHFTSLLTSNRTYNFSSLRCCLSAGESLPIKVHKDFSNKFNSRIIDAMGSTELLGFAISAGVEVKGVELVLKDEEGNIVPQGEIGELFVKSSFASVKYYNDLLATDYTFKKGWIKTNDMYQLNDGLYIHQGRRNDCIKINGVYVSFTNLEKDLYNLASVLEVAVVSNNNKYGLTRIEIYVVLKHGYNKDQEYANILDTFKSHNTMFNQPHTIKIVESLPRTPSGKIKKYILLTKE